MTIRVKTLILAAACTASLGCRAARYSPAGFQLPADGNIERGKQTFVAMGCHSCHDVIGAGLVRTDTGPATPVGLGGDVVHRFSDGYLVTSMINPDHEVSWQVKAQTMPNVSRMPSYADRMNVRQMIDVVAFLQANYRERQIPPTYTP